MEMKEFAEQMKTIIEESLFGVKKVHIQNVLKNNSVKLTALIIESKESNVAPTIYLESYYEKYKNGAEIETLAHEVIWEYRKNRRLGKINLNFICDWEQAKGMVAYRVINAEQNKELLKNVPHKNILDLAKVCYLSLYDGDASVLIHKGLCELWNISEAELLEAAEENTPKLFPQYLTSINEVMAELLKEGFGEAFDEEMECKIKMYLLTNISKCMGAAVMFYPECMEKIAEKLCSDFYILPSSIHEIIIMPVSDENDVEELAVTVKEINASMVDKGEVLSDRVYQYSRKQKEICIVA